MGMYDDVECSADLPGDLPIAGRYFQTKSLYRVLGKFTITRAGRLVFHCFQNQHSPEVLNQTAAPDPGVGDTIDLDFHGDIRLVTAKGEIGEYVVRFTHGTLEWVRLITNLSDYQRMLLRERHIEEE